jgi:hypothetical protein
MKTRSVSPFEGFALSIKIILKDQAPLVLTLALFAVNLPIKYSSARDEVDIQILDTHDQVGLAQVD